MCGIECRLGCGRVPGSGGGGVAVEIVVDREDGRGVGAEHEG